MNLLYLGRYKDRFSEIIKILSPDKDNKILEICFGDIYIARWCKANNIDWNGYDINSNFIRFAKLNGFNAYYYDLLEFKDLPKSNTVIIMGSFYHFHNKADMVVKHIMKSTDRLIISEPIRNLTGSGGIVGNIAKRLTKSGRGNETFRYNYESLNNTLRSVTKNNYVVKELMKTDRDIILEIKWK